MCGILFCSSNNTSDIQLDALRRRGPDYSQCINFAFPGVEQQYIAFCSILSQQGTKLYPQPVTIKGDSSDYLLLWNGEIYRHVQRVDASQSDTELLATFISQSKSVENLLEIFRAVDGPFAFILVQTQTGRVFFGRDRFGRRSLVCRLAEYSTSLDCLASLVPFADDERFFEVPASGVYSAQLIQNGSFQIKAWYPWSAEHFTYWSGHIFHTTFQLESVETKVRPLVGEQIVPNDEPNNVKNLYRLLSEAVEVRIRLSTAACHSCFNDGTTSIDCTHSRIGILFSGGLDSTVVAALADRFVPQNQPIDLINVAFQHLKPSGPTNKKTNTGTSTETRPQYASPDVAPDRLTALSSLAELQLLNPSRRWQLVKVDISVAELKRVRQERVRALLKPSAETTLNDSLALAMWFAARGQGKIHRPNTDDACSPDASSTLYISPVRVLLTGTGADEQLAGYSRHRNTFHQNGAAALEQELKLEMQRIAERNMGRDDRMISDHGREARFPFLDESVVSYLASLPFDAKADFNLPRGLGEKRLLRLVAESLGLREAAGLPKRAMQFGSRIAKSENLQKIRGADRLLTSEQE